MHATLKNLRRTSVSFGIPNILNVAQLGSYFSNTGNTSDLPRQIITNILEVRCMQALQEWQNAKRITMHSSVQLQLYWIRTSGKLTCCSMKCCRSWRAYRSYILSLSPNLRRATNIRVHKWIVYFYYDNFSILP